MTAESPDYREKHGLNLTQLQSVYTGFQKESTNMIFFFFKADTDF